MTIDEIFELIERWGFGCESAQVFAMMFELMERCGVRPEDSDSDEEKIETLRKEIEEQKSRIAEEEYCNYYDSGKYMEPDEDGHTEPGMAHPSYYEKLDKLEKELFREMSKTKHKEGN